MTMALISLAITCAGLYKIVATEDSDLGYSLIANAITAVLSLGSLKAILNTKGHRDEMVVLENLDTEKV